MRSRHPEPAERSGELQEADAVALLQEVERRAKVVVLLLELSRPAQAGINPIRVGGLTESEVVLGVPAAHRVFFAALSQELAAVLADRLQHPIALAAAAEKTFVDQ